MGLRPARTRKPTRPGTRWLAGVVAVVGLGAGVFWLALAPRLEVGGSGPRAPAAARRETRPTLDPAAFVGKAARAYRVAREIPEVLDRLYCYCECDRYYGHRSLLSCYTDGHAAT